MRQTPTVYCLGDANVDALLPITTYPQLGGDRRSQGLVLEAGGSTTNSAILLSHLGANTKLLACLGQDIFGEFLRNSLAETKLDLSHLMSNSDEPTGLVFIPVTEDGQRTLFGQRGANRMFSPGDLPTGFDDGGSLLLSGYALLEPPQAQAAAKAIHLARQADLMIVMDTAYEPPLVKPQAFTPFLAGLDVLVLGLEEAKKLSGQEEVDASIDCLQNAGVSTIALKLGKEGSLLIQRDQRFEIPALPQQVVDTTGAGDNYTGALLFGLLHGLPLASAGLLAAAAAAHILKQWGAGRQAGWPNDIYQILDQTSAELQPDLITAKEQLLHFLNHLDTVDINTNL